MDLMTSEFFPNPDDSVILCQAGERGWWASSPVRACSSPCPARWAPRWGQRDGALPAVSCQTEPELTEWQGLAGPSVGHPAQPPAEAGSPTAGCTAPRPGGAWISPEKETHTLKVPKSNHKPDTANSPAEPCPRDLLSTPRTGDSAPSPRSPFPRGNFFPVSDEFMNPSCPSRQQPPPSATCAAAPWALIPPFRCKLQRCSDGGVRW